MSSSDHILHDADKNFVSRKFRQFVISMTISIKAISIEAHWSIDVIERYHTELRRAYQMIAENLVNKVNEPDNETRINKKIILQMIVKAINDIVNSDELMLTLLVFDAYSRMHVINSSISSINQRAIAIEKAMTEMRKFKAERQVADALNTRNESIVISIHDLSLNSNVLIWRENNNQRDKWIESFKLLNMNNEICKIDLSSESIDFRSTVIKSFHVKSTVDVQSINDVELENVSSSDDEYQNFASEISVRFIRARRLLLWYQNFADITVFLQNDEEISSTSTFTFADSRRKEINELLKRQVFEIITISEVSKNVRIFKFRFVDEIKHSNISQTYEKSRLMIQTYNDHEKTLMLTQASTIQRMSQRIILAIAASISENHHLYLRNITQTYIQSKSSFNRMFFIRSSFDLNIDLFDDTILKIIKSLYDVSKAKAHWFNTYHDHHKKNLNMMKSTYDFCLLFINQNDSSDNAFELIEMQTNNTLMLRNDRFAELKESELKKSKLMFKKREMLIIFISIKFNDEIINLIEVISKSSYSLSLTQLSQFDQIRLINISVSVDLISSRDQIRKMMTSKDQYVFQRARDAYIVTMFQSEVSFDLFLIVSIINSKEEDANELNKRLRWQLDHSIRELNFVSLKIISSSLKLMIFIDASFANVNLHSQIDYVICLTDDVKANIIHWFFTKCKRMIRSVLAAKLYAMTNEFDADSVIKSIIKRILNIFLSMILLTDSRSLYDCLVKLKITSEKRLMIDLMCFRQSYERRKITKIRWINEDTNSIDAMTKINSCQTFTKLIDTNIIDLRTTAWVKRMNERATKNEEVIQKNEEIIQNEKTIKTISSLSSDVNVWSKDFINQVDWW